MMCLTFAWLFIRRQRNSEIALIDMHIFCNRSFSSAVLAGPVVSGCLMGTNLVLSQRLQLVMGLTPLQAGLYFLPLPMGAMSAGPLSGWLLSHFSSERFLSSVLTLYAAGTGMLMISFSSSFYWQIPCLFLLGACVGSCMTAASDTIMSAASTKNAGMAAAIKDLPMSLEEQ